MFLDFKSKHIIKGAVGQTERKQGKLTCESNPSEDSNIKKTKIKTKQRTQMCIFYYRQFKIYNNVETLLKN